MFKRTVIPQDSTAKYLGVHIDSKLAFSYHHDHAISKTKAIFSALAPIYRSKSLGLSVKLQVLTATAASVLTYGSPAWAFKLGVKKKFASSNHLLHRRLVKAPWFARNASILSDLKLPSF